ncbi:MAG TPA: hypothetical protein VF384_02750 [Planctomycetota bacterium]
MRVFTVCFVAACLAAQEAPPKPAETKQPWTIVAPGDEWFDAKRLADLVAAMQPLAEKYSGLKFVRAPAVRAADYASWEKLVGEEMPGARDPARAVAFILALYLPDRDEVVLGPVLTSYLLGKGPNDAAVHAQARLVHEIVHVLQQQHFQLASRMRAAENADEKLVLRSMAEGFATWVEEQVAAKEFALANYGHHNTKMYTRNGHMEFVRGRDFFARLHERGGEKAMHDAMRNPPMKLYDFVRVAIAKPATEAKPDVAPPPASEPEKKRGDGK